MMRSAIALVLLLQAASSSTVIRVDSRSQGRTFMVDTGRAEIRKSLRDVSAPPPAGGLPSWLPPYPGAKIVRSPDANGPQGFGYIGYTTSAPPDVVFGHYESAIRSTSGLTITYTYRQAGRGGAIHVENSTHTAVVSASPGAGPTDISINWRPKKIEPVPLAANARLEAVWYDDRIQILRLRDSATGKEYDLGMANMLSYVRSSALDPSARADYPAWLVAFPGSRLIVAAGPPADWRPQKASDMRSFNFEMEAVASVDEVAAFYRDVMARNGLTIVTESGAQTTSYAMEARNRDRTHQVYLEVLHRSRDTFIRLMDHFTLPRP
jgi:hypothetical protein